ncbi:MAG: 2-oxoacid:acceptor oxidoreductase family protein [Cocleimonas sp.]|nr:2-oxoacid:acceptor oxidoreductase family protein [Cocleimonas sp.]
MINLIISGIGGQGINSLAKVLANVLLQSGYHCQFTIHKGGAQSLGSVYAEFRIDDQKLPTLGQGIPKGQLDILISLEPWEALRHVSLAHPKTQFWVETQLIPLFIERANERSIESPHAQLDALPEIKIHWESYQDIAQQKAETIKMANYFAGLNCILAINSHVNFSIKSKPNNIDTDLFDTLFFKQIPKAKKIT